ncbi:matrixin family metalloprotease [Pseudonocardia acaciae]|uniref:matrixin family metalloprotease n=1 Tax=Pseudonocardia acaciae TaxID=551276 RepID=UPI000685414B|nr:matrixin family metalloprotease [Pseudonocardia acaciae]
MDVDHPEAADQGGRGRRRLFGGLDPIPVVSAAVTVALFVGLRLFAPGLVGGPEGEGRLREPSEATNGPHAFLAVTPQGRPVGYDPCRPIHFVVNRAGEPPDGMAVIHDAVREVEAASGFRFVDDGFTQEKPNTRRPPMQPGRYHQRWAPVLIAWANHAEYPDVGGDIQGTGGSTSIRTKGPESARYVTGQIVLNREGFAQTLGGGEDGRLVARAIAMHELGHVVGLDHVNDPGELMAPEFTGLVGFGPGDREGMARLRAGPCWPDD